MYKPIKYKLISTSDKKAGNATALTPDIVAHLNAKKDWAELLKKAASYTELLSEMTKLKTGSRVALEMSTIKVDEKIIGFLDFVTKKEQEERNQKNRYCTTRGLREYCDLLPDKHLINALQSLLKTSGLWLDSGAGNANAQKDFLKLLGDKANQVEFHAVGIVPPAGYEEVSPPNFRYYLTDILAYKPDTPINLITDVFGPFSYIDDILRLMQHYHELMKVGGGLFIYTGRDRTFVHTLQDGLCPIKEYLEKYFCGDSRPFTLIARESTFIILKKNDTPLQMVPFEQICTTGINYGELPWRTYFSV